MYDMVAGDFNGDGYMDLATIGYAGTIQVTLGPFKTGGGNLPAYNPPGNSQFSFAPPAATGAFRGGADSDLLTFTGLSATLYPQVWYWTGNTTNILTTFNSLPTSTVPAQPSFAVVADFNGDGNLDWAATNPSQGTVTVALGLGNGSFSQAPGSPFTLSGSPFTLAAADFNGDGKPDLAVDTGSNVVILLNAGGSLPQTIQFGPLSNQTYSNLPIAISAISSSGLPVSFTSSTPSVCGVSGTTVTLNAAGTCTVVAIQSGNSTYASAPPVSQSFTVNKAPQTITFAPISAQTLGAASFPLTATASSGLPVTYAAQPPAVCSMDGNLVQLIGPGTCSVTTSASGNSAYLAAAPVTQSFTISARAQTIIFNQIPPQGVGVTVTLVATSSAGLGPVTYTSNTPSVCTVSGSFAVTVSAGTCSITATAPASGEYAAAMPVTQTFTVSLSQQTIAFQALPPSEPVGAMFSLTASSTSGLAVAFTSNTPAVCTVANGQVTSIAPGTCSITATQSGNSNYAAAPPVTESFAVVSPALAPQTIAFGPLANRTLGSGAFSVSATASSGLLVSFASSTPATCSVSGNTVALLAAGSCTVTATQNGNGTYNAVPPVSQTFTISAPSLNPQTITFAALPNAALGVAPFTVTATASSGLPVTISSSTPLVCTVSGNIATILAAGTCTITATQSGNATYAAAAPVTQTFIVTAASTGPTITAVDNAASYASGVVAPSSYADIFGTNLASEPSDPSLSVTITDARGNQFAATILYA